MSVPLIKISIKVFGTFQYLSTRYKNYTGERISGRIFQYLDCKIRNLHERMDQRKICTLTIWGIRLFFFQYRRLPVRKNMSTGDLATVFSDIVSRNMRWKKSRLCLWRITQQTRHLPGRDLNLLMVIPKQTYGGRAKHFQHLATSDPVRKRNFAKSVKY